MRMQATEPFEQEVKPTEVARRLRVSSKSAYQWYRLWREGGVQALASRGPGGSRCRLSPRCLEKLAAYLDQGPACRETPAHTSAGGEGRPRPANPPFGDSPHHPGRLTRAGSCDSGPALRHPDPASGSAYPGVETARAGSRPRSCEVPGRSR
ncbi:helix-turn-helix domain-containing protein [Kitasatospora sp. NPDC058190]|uniref:helix-turn-helix domain-containing protein n=1 Tax=Kitasatospora sp. NPDC058190 TaxID=3346371 RepID=UPI0036D95E1E